jgi:membrane protein YdbS with pleckstrin-like domain
MLSKEKQKALMVVTITGLILIAAVSVLGFLAYLAFPLILALVCIIIGMLSKWVIEWVIKNAHRWKIKDKAEVVKKKLKIDEGVGLVKDSIDTLIHKEQSGESHGDSKSRSD